MVMQRFHFEWQKALWKILANPAFEAVAVLLAAALAAWVVVSTQIELRPHTHTGPILFGVK